MSLAEEHTKVTVLMPTFNADAHLSETLDSLVNQTYKNMDIVILDDCSSDKTVEIIHKYQCLNSNIHLYTHDENQGIIPTRNELFTLSNAPFLAIMDADDICAPNRIEIQVNYLLNHAEIDGVGSWFQFCGKQNTVVRNLIDAEEIRAALYIKNMFCNPTMMIRSEFLKRTNLRCHQGYAGSADYLFWIQACQLGTFVNIPQVLLQYRVHETQESTKNRDRQKRVHLRIVTELFSELGLTHLCQHSLEAIIWPLETEHIDLHKVGKWVRQMEDRLGRVDVPLSKKISHFIDLRYRSLCRMNGKSGLMAYLQTLGLVRLMQGKKWGLSFAVSCLK